MKFKIFKITMIKIFRIKMILKPNHFNIIKILINYLIRLRTYLASHKKVLIKIVNFYKNNKIYYKKNS